MRFRNILASGGVLLLGLLLWAFWIEPDSLQLRAYDLPLQHWPAAQSGLRIAVLADIHAGAPWIDDAKLHRICDLVTASRPDLILNTGDFVMGENPLGKAMTPEHIASQLTCLHAPLGVYAVLGNNDHFHHGGKAVQHALETGGTVVMENQIRRIVQGAHPFWLMGLADKWRSEGQIEPLLAKVNDDAPVIAFTHSPGIFPQIPPRVSLLVAGHTHGGQVNLPILGRPALRYLGISRYAAGHYSEQTDLFVSTGIGTNNLAVRFGVPPEISLLTLRPAP